MIAIQSSSIRLVLSFLSILVGVNLLYYLERKLALGIWDQPYTYLVAWTSSLLSALLFPYEVAHAGDTLIIGNSTSVVIESGCNGLEAMFLMLAGVLAFPASWRLRRKALLHYIPVLFLLNLLRVVILAYVAHQHPHLLDLFHYQVAQGVLVIFVLYFWVQYVGRASREVRSIPS